MLNRSVKTPQIVVMASLSINSHKFCISETAKWKNTQDIMKKFYDGHVQVTKIRTDAHKTILKTIFILLYG